MLCVCILSLLFWSSIQVFHLIFFAADIERCRFLGFVSYNFIIVHAEFPLADNGHFHSHQLFFPYIQECQTCFLFNCDIVDYRSLISRTCSQVYLCISLCAKRVFIIFKLYCSHKSISLSPLLFLVCSPRYCLPT